MLSNQIFYHNPISGNISSAKSMGNSILDRFLTHAINEGYKGDGVIFNAVHDELERRFGDVVVEFCRSLRTFDLVEVGFLLPKAKLEIADDCWYGGYLHTLEVTRKDDIETHPSILLCSSNGNRVIGDLHRPTTFVRGSSKDELLTQSLNPVNTAFELATNMISRLKQCEFEVLNDPILQIKRCHLPASAVAEIEKELGKSRSTRYELVCAISRYALRQDYEVAEKYFYSAGRVFQFKE